MSEQKKQHPILQFVRFPFLGARENGEPFEYLLLDINQNKTDIVISKWMVNRTILKLNEKVDLFIPSLLTAEYDLRHHSSSVITSVTEEKLLQEYLFEASFVQPLSITILQNWSLEEFSQKLVPDELLIDMLFRLIKDSLLLKQSILVYLKHLAPYFSRIVNYPSKSYIELKKVVFDGISNVIKKNENALETLYFFLKETIKNIYDISILLNLEDLREIMETEISQDLFYIAFSNITSRKDVDEKLNQSVPELNHDQSNTYMNYLFAIQNLEKRLYSNYNQIVLIYLKSISST